MLHLYSGYRLMQEFFDWPRKSFYIRELSRNIGLTQPAVINQLKKLEKLGLIIKGKEGIYPSYHANRDNEDFKLLKKQNIVLRIHKSGLIEYLDRKLKPNCIVLFGSAARGDDTEKSDIDIFVQAAETELELGKFEELLNRKINLLFETNINSLGRELLNNIINGQVLYGYLKVF